MYKRQVQFLGQHPVVLNGAAGGVGDDDRALVQQVGQVLLDEVLDTGVLQAHAVEHTRSGFGNAGRGVAQALGIGGALQRHTAQLFQRIHLLIFPAESETAGGGDDGVLELHTGDIYLQVCH